MPPRIANSPCSSAGSSRLKPASTSSSPRSVGAMSWLGRRSTDALSSRSGALTRGRTAAADATTIRADPPASAWSARARSEVTPSAASCRDTDRPRARGTAGPPDPPTHRTALRARRGRIERRRRPARDRASVGTMYRTAPLGIAWAAAATNSAFVEGVSPDTSRAGASMPLRATAVLRTARRFSEVEVVTGSPTSNINGPDESSR